MAKPILPTPLPVGNPESLVVSFFQFLPPSSVLYIPELSPLPIKFHAVLLLSQNAAYCTLKFSGS